MTIVILLITAALIVISLTAVINVFLLSRLARRPNFDGDLPRVSVMIPARNEADAIGETIRRLLAQVYPAFEVIVLDDDSTDGTGTIVQQLQETHDNLKLIHGAPLPEGWMGKNWACHQMQQAAQGEILVFTDADVRWEPDALRALIENMQTTRSDLYTVWPTQHTETWAERLTVPLMAFVIIGYLPILGTHYLPLSAFGAANGQCMAWRRKAYGTIGGHTAVSDNVLEDVTMARMVKGAGYRLRMADGNRLIQCRMYDGWKDVRDGFAKNILAGYGNSVLALVLGAVFHWGVFLFPWVWLAVDGFMTPYPEWPLALIAAGLGVRALTAAHTHQRIGDALLMPVSVLLMTRIAAQAIYWHYRYGGPQWKGRVIHRKSTT